MKKKRKILGMTIIEMLAVLFIAGILMSLAVPFVSQVNRAFKRHAAARAIASEIRSGRTTALAQGSACSVYFNSNNVTMQCRGLAVSKAYFLPSGIKWDGNPTEVRFDRNGMVTITGPNIVRIRTTNVNDTKVDTVTIYSGTGQTKITRNVL